jgi:hypothetical protein
MAPSPVLATIVVAGVLRKVVVVRCSLSPAISVNRQRTFRPRRTQEIP